MWHPDTDNATRPVQVSFTLDIDPPQYRLNETQLIPHLDDLTGLLNPTGHGLYRGTVTLDGSVSVAYRGEELLGTSFWIAYFYALVGLSELVCKGQSIRQTFYNSSGHLMTLSRKGSELAFESEIAGTTVARAILPFEPFVREWQLMQNRVGRIAAELGDESERRRLEDPTADFACDEFLEIVGEERVIRTATAPLAEVLADPVPF